MPDSAELGPNSPEGSIDPSLQAAQGQQEALDAINQEFKVRVSIGAIGMEKAEVVEVPITPTGENTEHSGKDLVPSTDQPPHIWSKDLVRRTENAPHSWSKDLVPTYKDLAEQQPGLLDRLKAGLVRRADQHPLSFYGEVPPNINVRVIPQAEVPGLPVVSETPRTTEIAPNDPEAARNKGYEETMKRQEGDMAKWRAEHEERARIAQDKRIQEARKRAEAAHKQERDELRAEQELEERFTSEAVLKGQLSAKRSQLAWASAEMGKIRHSKKSQEKLEKASNEYADQLAKNARFYSEAWTGDGLSKQDATKSLAEMFANESLAFDTAQIGSMSTLGKGFRVRQSISERRPMTYSKFSKGVLSESALENKKAQLVPYYERLISTVSARPRQPGDNIDIAPVLVDSFMTTIMNETKSRTLVKEPKERFA